MSEDQTEVEGPDFTQGVPRATIQNGTMLLGHVGDEPVLLVGRGDALFAIGASCSHYGAPLGDGCWSARPFAAPGITPASACAPEKCCARQRWTRCHAFGSKRSTGPFGFVRSWSKLHRRAPKSTRPPRW